MHQFVLRVSKPDYFPEFSGTEAFPTFPEE
jgi:hypothetical protein